MPSAQPDTDMEHSRLAEIGGVQINEELHETDGVLGLETQTDTSADRFSFDDDDDGKDGFEKWLEADEPMQKREGPKERMQYFTSMKAKSNASIAGQRAECDKRQAVLDNTRMMAADMGFGHPDHPALAEGRVVANLVFVEPTTSKNPKLSQGVASKPATKRRRKTTPVVVEPPMRTAVTILPMISNCLIPFVLIILA
ncbi:hypothetical protein FSHL1_009610 [Fusarium sambucinum]